MAIDAVCTSAGDDSFAGSTADTWGSVGSCSRLNDSSSFLDESFTSLGEENSEDFTTPILLNGSNKPTRFSVTFSMVHIREYERIISDHPNCTSGVPIGIGWNYQHAVSVDVDLFEDAVTRRFPCRILSRREREEMVRKWGATSKEIASAIRNALKVKNQRRQTLNSIEKKYDRWEEAFESTSKTLKKVLRSDNKRWFSGSSTTIKQPKIYHTPLLPKRSQESNLSTSIDGGESPIQFSPQCETKDADSICISSDHLDLCFSMRNPQIVFPLVSSRMTTSETIDLALDASYNSFGWKDGIPTPPSRFR